MLAVLAITTNSATAQRNGEAGRVTTSIGRRTGPLVGDMQGYGAFAMFPLRTDWSLGVSADRLYYDMETPVDVTGIRSADARPVDAFINV